MVLVTDSKRPQPLWKPPPTACLTATRVASEAPSLLMHPWPPQHNSNPSENCSRYCHPSEHGHACVPRHREPTNVLQLLHACPAGIYWKRGGIRLFKSWTLVRLEERRGEGGGGGRGLAGPPLLLCSPLPRRQRRHKFFLSLNPLVPKARKKILPQTVEGEEGGHSLLLVVSRSGTSLLPRAPLVGRC